jgi:hypothetical protein
LNSFLCSLPSINRYDTRAGTISKVDFPADDALIFDVETLVLKKNCPVIAVAASSQAWSAYYTLN